MAKERKGRASRTGRWGGGEEGACRCYGNVGNVSEKSQTFQGKERARGKNMWAKEEGVMAKKEGAWAKNELLSAKSEYLSDIFR